MSYFARFVKNGNIKVGTSAWTFSKLAGSGVIAGCKGTCGAHCTGCYNAEDPQSSPCYVFDSYLRYGWEKSTVVKGHIRNTTIIREDLQRAFDDLRKQIKRAKKKPVMIRVHASGELETVQELKEWLNTALMFPTIPFYIYTKAYEVLNIVLASYSESELPANFFINVSVWHEEGIAVYNRWQHLKTVRAFVYDDGTFDYEAHGLKLDGYCPAYRRNKKGKVKLYHDLTCDKCKICFQSKAKILGCLAH